MSVFMKCFDFFILFEFRGKVGNILLKLRNDIWRPRRLTYPTANYVCDAASVLQCWESNVSSKTSWSRQFQKKLCKAHKRTNLVQSLPWNECILAMFCVQTSRGGCSDQNNLSDLTSEVRECHCTAPSLQGRWENTEATFTSLSCGAIYWSNSHPQCH